MKKPQVSGRTCPHCLVITDPVCYGWHVGKCSSRKLAQDMAPGTPIKNEVASNPHFVEAPIHVLSPRDTPTLSPDCQIAKDGVSGRLPSIVQSLDSSKEELNRLREENQALKKDLKHKLEENEALNDKLKDLEPKLDEKQALVKNLEFKLEYLELRLKLSEEAEKKALCLLESLCGSSREKNEQGNEEGVHRQPTQSSYVKDLGPVECSGADPGDSDNQFCHKQVEERDMGTYSAKSDNLDKRLDLDRIVDLACGEGAMSHGFLSHVEGIIKAKEALPLTSRKQRILSGALSNARNEDDNQDIAEKSCNPRGSIPNLRNESSPRETPHEDQHFASHTSKPFQNVVNKEVPFMSSAPSDAIGTQCLSEDFNNMGCVIGLQADGHGGAEVNAGKRSACMREAHANWLAPEMQYHAVDTSLYAEKEKSVASLHVSSEKESDLNTKQIMKTQLHSGSVSAGSDINAIKAKPGFRRMVLQSDSENESGNIQGIHSGRDTCQAHLCDSKQNALPPVSSDAEGEKSDHSSVVFRVKNMCTSGKAGQPHLRRSKRLNVVCISDQSDDVICKREREQNNNRSAEGPRIAATDLEGAGVDGITDGEHTGVRRSKRLRKMSIQNPKNSLQKERVHVETFSSSGGDETSGNLEGSEVSESEASASISNAAFETQVKRKGPSRTRKRLFEENESRPLYGNMHSTDCEEDDSEIESDADSLKDFIIDSEGRESSRSSCEDHSSSSSYSSREVYRDPRHKRDIKIRNYVWELEGEMLSMLAIDPKLCLRAVCALNRRQTEDEQKEKISKYTNKRGFDNLHAARGSRLAEFLTDGDVSGPMKKSVEDLDKFDAGGLQFCKMLASKHSKQLFEMYTNAEDHHFPFS